MKVRVGSAVDSQRNLRPTGTHGPHQDHQRALGPAPLGDRRVRHRAARRHLDELQTSLARKEGAAGRRRQLAGPDRLARPRRSPTSTATRRRSPTARSCSPSTWAAPRRGARSPRRWASRPTQISADGPFSTLTDRSTYQATPAGPRANQLTEENAVYRLVFDAQLSLPIISIYTQAPDAESAIELASAATSVLTSYVTELDNGIPEARQITVSQLGQPEGGTVNDGANPILAFLAFLGVFVVLCTLIVLGSGLVRQWRKKLRDPDSDAKAPAQPTPVPPMPATSCCGPRARSIAAAMPGAAPPRRRASTGRRRWPPPAPVPTSGRGPRGCCRGASPPSWRCCSWSRSTRWRSPPPSPTGRCCWSSSASGC